MALAFGEGPYYVMASWHRLLLFDSVLIARAWKKAGEYTRTPYISNGFVIRPCGEFELILFSIDQVCFDLKEVDCRNEVGL